MHDIDGLYFSMLGPGPKCLDGRPDSAVFLYQGPKGPGVTCMARRLTLLLIVFVKIQLELVVNNLRERRTESKVVIFKYNPEEFQQYKYCGFDISGKK